MSPMQAHCQDIKKRNPLAKTVFVGPCVAKKDEAEYYEGIVDAVLTFEELSEMLKEDGITLEKEMDSAEKSRARFFPTTGGVLKTMAKQIPGYKYVAIDGVEKVEVNLLVGKMTVTAESSDVVAPIITAIQNAGYGASIPGQKKQESTGKNDDLQQMKRRIIGSAVCLAVLMYFTMGHMIGLPAPKWYHGTQNAMVHKSY